jgi:transcriptional regulator with XRE-family HTH domain
MPSKSPVIFPQEQRLLAAFGERLRLARLRRALTTVTVSKRAGISRTTLYKAEHGDPGVTLGTYLRILATMGLDKDFDSLAADDKVGRKLQDLGLDSVSHPKRGKNA